MKTTLTIEQSAELIKRGVTLNENDSDVFDIGDLLSLLPKKIDDTYRLKIQSCDWPTWTVCYIDSQSGAKGWHQSMELIDALYKVMIWAIDHNHVKLD